MAIMKSSTLEGSNSSVFGVKCPCYIILISSTSLTKDSRRFSCMITRFITETIWGDMFLVSNCSRNIREVARGVLNSWLIVEV
jgi:hypothetical protein